MMGGPTPTPSKRDPLGSHNWHSKSWGLRVGQKEVRIRGLLDVIDLLKRLIFIFRPDLVVPTTAGWNDRWDKDTSRGDDT